MNHAIGDELDLVIVPPDRADGGVDRVRSHLFQSKNGHAEPVAIIAAIMGYERSTKRSGPFYPERRLKCVLEIND
jgi:hypothetical protein